MISIVSSHRGESLGETSLSPNSPMELLIISAAYTRTLHWEEGGKTTSNAIEQIEGRPKCAASDIPK